MKRSLRRNLRHTVANGRWCRSFRWVYFSLAEYDVAAEFARARAARLHRSALERRPAKGGTLHRPARGLCPGLSERLQPSAIRRAGDPVQEGEPSASLRDAGTDGPPRPPY
jgi:hypothetical protein